MMIARRRARATLALRIVDRCHLKAHLDNLFCARRGESLRVGVGDDEVDPGEAGDDHVVDRIAAGAAYQPVDEVWKC